MKYIIDTKEVKTCTTCIALDSDSYDYRCKLLGNKVLNNECVRVKPVDCPLVKYNVTPQL